MRFALGMDNREIARAMGKTNGATKVLLTRDQAARGDGDADITPAGPTADFETTLRFALHPVDLLETLKARVESTLQELTDAAVEELDAWEMGAMRDPRNRVRPVIASAVGVTRGTALVVLRVRAGRKKRAGGLERPTRPHPPDRQAAAGEARKIARRD